MVIEEKLVAEEAGPRSSALIAGLKCRRRFAIGVLFCGGPEGTVGDNWLTAITIFANSEL